jgi:hypothetical protein
MVPTTDQWRQRVIALLAITVKVGYHIFFENPPGIILIPLVIFGNDRRSAGYETPS